MTIRIVLCFCVSLFTFIFGAPLFAQNSNTVEVMDLREQTIDAFDQRIQNSSRTRVVIVARGYDHEFLQQVYNGLRDVTDQSIPITYVLTQNAPERAEEVMLEVFVAGSSFGEPTIHLIGDPTPANTRFRWRDLGIQAHNRLIQSKEEQDRSRARQEQLRQQFLSTSITTDFQNLTETVADWINICENVNNPAKREITRDRMVSRGRSQEDAELGVQMVRISCVDALNQIERLRASLGIQP